MLQLIGCVCACHCLATLHGTAMTTTRGTHEVYREPLLQAGTVSAVSAHRTPLQHARHGLLTEDAQPCAPVERSGRQGGRREVVEGNKSVHSTQYTAISRTYSPFAFATPHRAHCTGHLAIAHLQRSIAQLVRECQHTVQHSIAQHNTPASPCSTHTHTSRAANITCIDTHIRTHTEYIGHHTECR